MYDNPAINFHGLSDPTASFDRLAGILREKIRDRCCNFIIAKRKEEDLSYGQKRKQRRVVDSGHREVTYSKAEVLKKFIPHQTRLIEVVLEREWVDLSVIGEEWRK